MRGGVTVTDLLYTYSFEDRQSIYTVVTENMETTKETRLPFI